MFRAFLILQAPAAELHCRLSVYKRRPARISSRRLAQASVATAFWHPVFAFSLPRAVRTVGATPSVLPSCCSRVQSFCTQHGQRSCRARRQAVPQPGVVPWKLFRPLRQPAEIVRHMLQLLGSFPPSPTRWQNERPGIQNSAPNQHCGVASFTSGDIAGPHHWI